MEWNRRKEKKKKYVTNREEIISNEFSLSDAYS